MLRDAEPNAAHRAIVGRRESTANCSSWSRRTSTDCTAKPAPRASASSRSTARRCARPASTAARSTIASNCTSAWYAARSTCPYCESCGGPVKPAHDLLRPGDARARDRREAFDAAATCDLFIVVGSSLHGVPGGVPARRRRARRRAPGHRQQRGRRPRTISPTRCCAVRPASRCRCCCVPPGSARLDSLPRSRRRLRRGGSRRAPSHRRRARRDSSSCSGPRPSELEDALRRRLGAGAAVAVSSGTRGAVAVAARARRRRGRCGGAAGVHVFRQCRRRGARWCACRSSATSIARSFLAGAAAMRAADRARVSRCESGALSPPRGPARSLAALMPVHLYGRACDMAAIVDLARETGARVIEDAAQAIDAARSGKSVGRFGDSGCFSFYPTKNLGGAGDGGLVVCEDAGARRCGIARLRTHGGEHGSYEHHEVGVNARMSELVAAVLNAKLACLDAWTARRRSVAAPLRRRARPRGGCAECSSFPRAATRSPMSGTSTRCAFRRRRGRAAIAVQRILEEQGIATRVFYPLPLHLQPCFAGSRRPSAGDLPAAEAAAREVLCLPIYPSLADGVRFAGGRCGRRGPAMP